MAADTAKECHNLASARRRVSVDEAIDGFMGGKNAGAVRGIGCGPSL